MFATGGESKEEKEDVKNKFSHVDSNAKNSTFYCLASRQNHEEAVMPTGHGCSDKKRIQINVGFVFEYLLLL